MRCKQQDARDVDETGGMEVVQLLQVLILKFSSQISLFSSRVPRVRCSFAEVRCSRTDGLKKYFFCPFGGGLLVKKQIATMLCTPNFL